MSIWRYLLIGIVGTTGGVLGNLLAALLEGSIGRFSPIQAAVLVIGVIASIIVSYLLSRKPPDPPEPASRLRGAIEKERLELRLLRQSHRSGMPVRCDDVRKWQNHQRRIQDLKHALVQTGDSMDHDPIDDEPPPPLAWFERMRLLLIRPPVAAILPLVIAGSIAGSFYMAPPAQHLAATYLGVPRPAPTLTLLASTTATPTPSASHTVAATASSTPTLTLLPTTTPDPAPSSSHTVSVTAVPTLKEPPVAGLLDQSQPQHNEEGLPLDLQTKRFQEFVPTLNRLSAVDVYLFKTGTPGDVIMEIRGLDGGLVSRSRAERSAIVTGWLKILLPRPIELVPQTTYRIFLILEHDQLAVGSYHWAGSQRSSYPGETDRWEQPDFDYAFRTYGFASATATHTPLATHTPTLSLPATVTPTDTSAPTDTASAIPSPTTTQSPLPTLSDTVVPSPSATGTPTPMPSLSPTNSPTPTAAPSHTSAAAPTFTATLTHTPKLTTTKAPMSTPTPAGIQRTVRLGGTVEALHKDGKFVWSAVKLECLDENGDTIRFLDVGAVEGVYLLPPRTSRVKPWIGPELGNWWAEWDCQPAEVTEEETVILRIVSKGGDDGGPPPATPPTNTPSP